MATVTAYTAERSQQIEDTTVVTGSVSGDDLILQQRDGTQINAGNVRGPQGVPGSNGINGAGHIICTSTTRPSLTPADEGKTIYETDTDLVRTWIGTRWRLQERIICTSLTRPTGMQAADEGTQIIETDTNLQYTWDGVRWVVQDYIICTSTTRPTTLTTSDVGTKIYETDTFREMVWLGTRWGNAVPRNLIDLTSTGPSSNNTNVAAVPPGGTRTITLDTNRRIRIEVFTVQNCNYGNHRIAMAGMMDGVNRASFTYESGRANVNYSGNAMWEGNVNAGSHTFAIGNISPDQAGVVVVMNTGAHLLVTDMGPAV